MKRLVVVLLGLLVIGFPRPSSADWIVVWSPVAECYILDNAPRQYKLDVVHRLNTGSRASRFKIVVDPILTLDYVSETHAVANTLGSFQSGAVICYGECTVGDVFLGTITYQGYGTSPDCGFVRVVPYPGAETLDIVNCEDEAEVASTLFLEVATPTKSCFYCSPHTDPTTYSGTPHTFGCEPLSTSTSTWGAIKALYR